MPKVFICYRREDSAGIAGRMYDRLVSRYSQGSVFWDVDTIPFGVDFRQHVSDCLNGCEAVLVLIGDRWLEAQTEGKRRIDLLDDYVRVEIEAALSLGILVMPVLIGRASMPKREDLPASLANIVYHNAATIDPGRDFHANMEKILLSIEEVTRAARTSGAPNEREERYHLATIGRDNPMLFVFLVDQSASMGETFAGTPNKSRAEAIADIVNKMLTDMVLRCTMGDKVRDYFHIGVLGYGGLVSSALTGALSNRQLVRVSEIADMPARIEKRIRLDAGGTPTEITCPVWIEPRSDGGAPMCEALRKTYHIVRDWISNGHARTFPPIVFNITDGAATDGDPRLPARNVTRLGTDFGNVLLFNCCHSSIGGDRILFPDNIEVIPDEYGKMLFEMSSRLPSQMRRTLRREGLNVSDQSRGFTFQSDFVDLVRFLDMGTRPAPLR